MVRDGALFLVNDYGVADPADCKGLRERPPQIYGNSLAHHVHFPLFDAFCPRAGLSFARTRPNPLRSVHTAAVRYQPETPKRFRKAFARLYERRQDGEEMLELGAAADEWFKKKAWLHAARLFQRCLKLDPESAEVLFKLGKSCFEAGHTDLALRYLSEGRTCDVRRGFDFDFQIGRCHHKLGRTREAIDAYTASLAREEDASTHCNIGLMYEAERELGRAYACYQRALVLMPKYDRARALLERLREVWPACPKEAATGAGPG
jgi:tetratricopeptide (TPR) repeat protein